MRKPKLLLPLMVLLVAMAARAGDAFIVPPATTTRSPCRASTSTSSALPATPARSADEEQQQPSNISLKRRLLSFVQETLWPGAQPDPTVDAELPPGSLGCPFLGSDSFLSGNEKDGPGCFFRQGSRAAGDPGLYKFYFFGGPVASVSGKELVTQVTNLEFSHLEALSPTYNDGAKTKDDDATAATAASIEATPSVFGNDNLMFERNRNQHAFLRRIMQAGMSAGAMQEAFPIVHDIAQERIQSLLTSRNSQQQQQQQQHATSPEEVWNMETICAEYTLEVTQKQVLGLELPLEEVALFRRSMTTWLGALYSPIANLNIPWVVRHTPEYKARLHIQGKIDEKIDALLEPGTSDASVLSKMLFAVDEETNNQKLNRSQVVENALLLMITGSETSSGTLALMMLLLGLHPHVLRKLQEEQASIQQEYGPDLQLQLLDEHHAPYLNAVMKETMRMGPLTGGFPKRATRTIEVDGHQIPKGWSVFNNVRLTHQLDPSTRLPNDAHMNVHTGFRPERWLSPDTTPQEFIPFGTGPRYCIGAPLATLQIQLFLATLARKVDSFELVEDYSHQKPVVWNPSTMVPRPTDGVRVQNFVPMHE